MHGRVCVLSGFSSLPHRRVFLAARLFPVYLRANKNGSCRDGLDVGDVVQSQAWNIVKGEWDGVRSPPSSLHSTSQQKSDPGRGEAIVFRERDFLPVAAGAGIRSG